MRRGDRSVGVSGSAVALVTLVAMTLVGWPVRPGYAAAPASLEVEVSSGAHGPLPQAAPLFRTRMR